MFENEQNQNDKANQTKGTGFTNINRVLGANTGAGERIGSTIGNKLSDQASSVRQGIQAGQNQFQQQKTQAGNNASSNISAGQNLTKQAGETDDAYAARVGQGGQDYSKIGENLRNTQYGGPMGIDNADQIRARSATVGALGQLAGSAPGQTQLLQNMVAKRGNYTQGQSALDQLLLGQTGQSAIQQGRRSTVGLQQNAQNATDIAANQANALKGSIATNKQNTINNLQNAVTGDQGIQTMAAQNAQKFQGDAQKLSQLLSGQFVPKTDEEKAQAQDLLGRMGDFGLDNYNLYTKNPDQTKNALSQLAGSLTQNFGARKYTDDQSKAGQNLADVLGDTQLKDQIAKNQFNTDVFGKESEYLNPLDKARTFDTESKDILTRAGNQIKGMEDTANSANKDKLASDLQKLNASNLPQDQKAGLADYLNKQYNSSNTSLSNGGQSESAADVATNMGNFIGGDPAGSLRNLGIDNNYQRYIQGTEATNNPFAKYGFLNYADRGEADIDPRFKGLGLNVQNAGGSGLYRSSGQLLNAADKVMGQDQSLKDFVLKQMMGIS